MQEEWEGRKEDGKKEGKEGKKVRKHKWAVQNKTRKIDRKNKGKEGKRRKKRKGGRKKER